MASFITINKQRGIINKESFFKLIPLDSQIKYTIKKVNAIPTKPEEEVDKHSITKLNIMSLTNDKSFSKKTMTQEMVSQNKKYVAK